jgi:hypothetical protein
MATEAWLSFSAVVKEIDDRLRVGAGRAQALARQAIDSGEIRLSFTSAAVAADDKEAWEQLKRSVQAGAPGLKMSGSMLNILRSRGHRAAYQRAFRRQVSLTEFGSPEFKAGLAAGKILANRKDVSNWLDREAPTAQTKPVGRRSKDQERARTAMNEQWGAAGPPQHLRNDEIVRIGNQRLKLMGQREASPTTWLRALGKKK